MENAIELHQALHGYGDEHQLLSSSIRLTREQQWQMLVMSDLSGPAFRAGFESYLTGYPLAGGGLYCFARTWYAPELPRPGCVWTHTILISDTDVARISDFRSILPHFRRPSSTKDVDSYGGPIYENSSAQLPHDFDGEVCSALLYLLYWSASGTVAITSNSSRPYEELVLAVFSQQWPRLRRNFSFCTGALAIRDPAFDCVVAPHDALRQDAVGRSAITLMPADPKLMGEQSSEDWVRVAVNDLLMTDLERPLRRFLWKFGPDYIEGRKAFRPLCEIYLAASRSRESVEQALSATAHFFPDIDSAVRLKTEFFGSRGSFSRESRGEALVLQALVTHPAGGCVPEDIAAIEQRARLLVRSEKDGAIRVAVAASSVGGIRAEQYLDGFAAGVISNPELLYVMSPSLKSDLLTRNPALLTLPELWRGPTDQQLAIAAHVASLRSLSRLAAPITRAILSAEAWPCLPSVLAKFGKGAVAETLAWVDQIPQSTLSLEQPVLEALGEQRSVLAEVLQQKPLGARALRVASALLDPRADVIRALGAKVWVGLVGADITSRPLTPKYVLRHSCSAWGCLFREKEMFS